MNDRSITFVFRKTGRFRWISYIDFLRLVVYGFRRAGYPVMFSQGFKPKPLYISLQSVPLGVDVLVDVVTFKFPTSFEPISDPRGYFPEGMEPVGWLDGELPCFWGVYNCRGWWFLVKHPDSGLRSVLKRIECEPYDTIRWDVLIRNGGRLRSVGDIMRRW